MTLDGIAAEGPDHTSPGWGRRPSRRPRSARTALKPPARWPLWWYENGAVAAPRIGATWSACAPGANHHSHRPSCAAALPEAALWRSRLYPSSLWWCRGAAIVSLDALPLVTWCLSMIGTPLVLRATLAPCAMSAGQERLPSGESLEEYLMVVFRGLMGGDEQ